VDRRQLRVPLAATGRRDERATPRKRDGIKTAPQSTPERPDRRQQVRQTARTDQLSGSHQRDQLPVVDDAASSNWSTASSVSSVSSVSQMGAAASDTAASAAVSGAVVDEASSADSRVGDAAVGWLFSTVAAVGCVSRRSVSSASSAS